MDNIELLHNIYVVSLTAAIIMAVITIVLFFVLDMRHTIGRLFGINKRKEIRQMETNSQDSKRLNSRYNKEMKNKVFTDTGSLKKNQTPAERLGMTGSESPPAETSLIDLSETQTTLLSQKNAEIQTSGASKDTGGDATTLLSNKAVADLQFMIIKQIIMINTDENIEIR